MYEDALRHFKKTDPLLYELAESIDPIVLEKSSNHFIRLVRAIVGQQLSVKAASTIFGRFEKLFKKGISADQILKLQDDDIRACGISYPKIEYIKDLSEKVRSKELLLDTFEHADETTIIENLTKVKGIGIWSAEMFLMFALARPDVFSVGDLGLKNAMIKLYGIKKPTNEKLIKLSKKWSPYRTYACRILWQSLDNAPK
ncbi:MAG: DNA-3-methyladenine glycosylase [Candidatus Levybacteria bacterium]|nr:DNA-3-methyladenine glycosylase [Candidatus Levybacteria bacterium]